MFKPMTPVIYSIFSCLLPVVTFIKICLTRRTSRSFTTAVSVSMLLFLQIEANIWVAQALRSCIHLFIFRRHIYSMCYMREHSSFVCTRPCISISLAPYATQVLQVNCAGLVVRGDFQISHHLPFLSLLLSS